MSIINKAMYLPTMQTFIEHWAEVNEALSSKPLVLPGGFTLADFIALRISIKNDITAVTSDESLATGAHAAVHPQKKALLQCLTLFRKAMLGNLPDTIYIPRLPTLPPFTAGQTRFMKPLELAAESWLTINNAPPPGFTSPLVLADGTTRADFAAALATLDMTYSAITKTEVAVGDALTQRDANMTRARQRMKQYRLVVVARLAPGNSLLPRLPRLSPKPGNTPAPVTDLNLTFDGHNAATLSFTPSPSANLVKYELRYAPPPAYEAENEVTQATIPAAAPPRFTLPLNGGMPGKFALFKVYTVNKTGNARGSKVMKVKRAVQEIPSLLQRAA